MCKKMEKELKISNFEISALTGKGINEAFKYLAEEIMNKKGDVISDTQSFAIKSSTRRISNKEGCCYNYSNK